MADLFGSDTPTLDQTDRDFVRVAVERSVDRYPSGLLYAVPDGLDIEPGHRVLVPLGRGDHRVAGTVVDRLDAAGAAEEGVPPEKIKPLLGRADDLPPLPGELITLARLIASYYACPIGIVLASIVPAAVRKGVGATSRMLVRPAEPRPDPLPRLGKTQRAMFDAIAATPEADLPISSADLAEQTGIGGTAVLRRLEELGLVHLEKVTTIEARAKAGSGLADRTVTLNRHQEAAVAAIGSTLGGGFSSHLLFGVTGSGNTEVYLRLVGDVLAAGRTALVLVPEIALTPQTTARFLARFHGVPAAVLHSGLTAAQRHQEWRRAASGEARIVLGAR